MLSEEFIKKLFALVGVAPADHDQMMIDLHEIMSLRLVAQLLEKLPPGKREIFTQLIKSGQVDLVSINTWLEKNELGQDTALRSTIKITISEALRDFFVALTQDLPSAKKQEVINLSQSYLT